MRIQALRPGLALQEAWADADALDDVLERHLDYAFSPVLGYLTSCPTNVGTGMRAAAWSAPRIPDFHYPPRFGELHFEAAP